MKEAIADKKNNNKRLKIVLAFGIVLVLSLTGFRLLNKELKYPEDLMALKSRQEKIKTLGVTFEGERVSYYEREFIDSFENVPFKKPRPADEKESDEIALLLLNDQVMLAHLEDELKLAEARVEIAMPSESDFLIKQNSIASRRAVGSIKKYVENSLKQGNIDEAIRGCELQYLLGQIAIKSPAEEAAVYWYGLNTSLLENMFEISQVGSLNENQKNRLLELVSPEASILSLDKFAIRQCQEMVLLTRSLGDLDEDKQLSIQLHAEGNVLPESAKSKSMRDVMESNLLDAWIAVFEKLEEDDSPEFVGSYMDEVATTRVAKVKNIEPDYMVMALPFLFEQIGRMNMRIVSARSALAIVLNDKIVEGEHNAVVSNLKVALQVRSEGDQWVITTPYNGPKERYNKHSGLEIHQHMGIRLFVSKS